MIKPSGPQEQPPATPANQRAGRKATMHDFTRTHAHANSLFPGSYMCAPKCRPSALHAMGHPDQDDFDAPDGPPIMHSPMEAARIDGMLLQYADVFKDISGMPPDRVIDHVIPLLDDKRTPFRRPYRLSPTEQNTLQERVDDLLKSGHIEPSSSPYGSPVLFALKKDDSELGS